MVGKAHDEEGAEGTTRQVHDREATRAEILERLR